jgi:hypothetical protein
MSVSFTLKPLIEAQSVVEDYITNYLAQEGKLPDTQHNMSRFVHEVEEVMAKEERWVMMNYGLAMYLTLSRDGDHDLTTTITWREL